MKMIPKAVNTLLACLLLACSGAANAQSAFPSRQVRIILPFPAGGRTDIIARVVAENITPVWKQPVIVENRVGASGATGVDYVAKSPPDGHTIVFTAFSPLTVNVALFGNLPYDPRADLAPITLVSYVPQLVVVPAALPVADMQALIEHIRARPGKLFFGSPGNGTLNHLHGEQFKRAYGLDSQHVPYKGNPQLMAGMRAGDVQYMFDNLSSALPQVKAGVLKALAVTGTARWPALPELPTLTESGIPGFEGMAWFAFVAPAKTPREIIARLHHDITAVLARADVKSRIEGYGMIMATSTPEQLARLIDADIERLGALVRQVGAKVD